MLFVSHISVIILGGAAIIFAPNIIKLFIDNDSEVIKIGTAALIAQSIALQFIPLGVLCNMTFQSIGKSWTASILSSLRQGVFFIPLILLLPKWLDNFGVEIAQAVADVLNFFVAIPFFIWFLRSLKKSDSDQSK
jgi:Na+-driven multidrug efflux pump